jgi:hypothetical protein
MKIYLAAAFSRQAEMKQVAFQLIGRGFEVTSQWLTNTPGVIKGKKARMQDAFMDINDLREADILVRFSDDLTKDSIPAKLGSGARMFEFGMAWERGMPIVVVGGRQNIFDSLPNVTHVADLKELFEYLGELS